MKRVLITGAGGFIGRNLQARLRARADVHIETFTRRDAPEKLFEWAKWAKDVDIVFHLAGVNRPRHASEFDAVNAGLTHTLVEILARNTRPPLVVFASSIQAAQDNPYGRSKKAAEDALIGFAERCQAPVRIFRLPNVFGKWCRPNYNSVVATFCHNLARGLPITISEENRVLQLVYIDDVMAAFCRLIGEPAQDAGACFCDIHPIFSITLGELAQRIKTFAMTRETLLVPDFSSDLSRALYATFIAALEEHCLSYPLTMKSDPRGWLAELIKSDSFGQIFVSKTQPGITRGNHYHHSKVEKFCVLQGDAVIRFRHVLKVETIAYAVSGRKIEVIDIPPGYTHNIENIGGGELITLFWANRIFDPDQPDTYYDEV